jgi:hypothetical protein
MNDRKTWQKMITVLMLVFVTIAMSACCDKGGAGQGDSEKAQNGAAVKTRNYTITKISGLPEWDKIPKLDIDNVLWLKDAGVKAYGQLCYDEEDLYVHLSATEKDIRAKNTKPLSAVNEDSCLEFFFMPAGGDRYFNFEVNPNGCMHYQIGHDRTDRL